MNENLVEVLFTLMICVELIRTNIRLDNLCKRLDEIENEVKKQKQDN